MLQAVEAYQSGSNADAHRLLEESTSSIDKLVCSIFFLFKNRNLTLLNFFSLLGRNVEHALYSDMRLVHWLAYLSFYAKITPRRFCAGQRNIALVNRLIKVRFDLIATSRRPQFPCWTILRRICVPTPYWVVTIYWNRFQGM